MENKNLGKLYLIPTTLGDTEPLEVLPISIKRTIENVNYFIVENEKTARGFIKKISSGKSQSGLNIELLNKFTEPEIIPTFLQPCLEGKDVGIISEAGCPGIADPGADVVRIATGQSQLFIETPYRNDKLFAELCKTLNPYTKVCVACDITLPAEYISTKLIKDWSKEKLDLHKRPTIFIIQA